MLSISIFQQIIKSYVLVLNMVSVKQSGTKQ